VVGIRDRVLLKRPIMGEPVQLGLRAEGFVALTTVGAVHARVGQPAGFHKRRETKTDK
jgi:hypothetical protein